MRLFVTSHDEGHSHYWNTNMDRTSFEAGHSHVVDRKSKIAMDGGNGHTHKFNI